MQNLIRCSFGRGKKLDFQKQFKCANATSEKLIITAADGQGYTVYGLPSRVFAALIFLGLSLSTSFLSFLFFRPLSTPFLSFSILRSKCLTILLLTSVWLGCGNILSLHIHSQRWYNPTLTVKNANKNRNIDHMDARITGLNAGTITMKTTKVDTET